MAKANLDRQFCARMQAIIGTSISIQKEKPSWYRDISGMEFPEASGFTSHQLKAWGVVFTQAILFLNDKEEPQVIEGLNSLMTQYKSGRLKKWKNVIK